MMVLFIGSRGSGKTTIANAVDERLTGDGYTCIRQFPGLVRRPLGRAVATAITLWRFFDYRLFTILGFKGRSPRIIPSAYRLYMPLAFNQDLHRLARPENDILLYDSNILRALVAGVVDGSITPKFIADFCKQSIVPKAQPLMVVVVRTDSHEAVRRWVTRDEVSLTEAERATAVAERDQLQDAIDDVAHALGELEGVHLVRVNGGDAPVSNATRIVESITSVFGKRKSATE